MKVLFTFGGLAHYYNPIFNRLNQIPGLEIVVVVPQTEGKALGSGVYTSMKGVDFKVRTLPEQKAWYGKPSFKGFTQLLEEEKPDAIVTVWPYVLSFLLNPAVRMKVKKLGIKLIFKDIPFNIPRYHEARKFYKEQKMLTEVLDSSDNKGIIHTIKYDLVTYVIKKYLNLMDAHVYYTEDAFDVIGSYGVPKEKIFIISNSIDTDKLLEVKEKIEKETPLLPPNKYRIIHIGRLVKWKRVDMLVDVFEKLKVNYPEAELVIVGSGPEEETLKQQVKSKNLENSVVFTGAIYEPEILGRYLLDSAIYVLAGMGGLSINEAMCFGKPVICSVADGTEKVLVREDYNGKYFTNGDPEDLHRKIEYLFSQPELIQKFGENSLHIIQNEVNIHRVISGYVQAFNYVNPQAKLSYNRSASSKEKVGG